MYSFYSFLALRDSFVNVHNELGFLCKKKNFQAICLKPFLLANQKLNFSTFHK
jgi:hypothetical protein